MENPSEAGESGGWGLRVVPHVAEAVERARERCVDTSLRYVCQGAYGKVVPRRLAEKKKKTLGLGSRRSIDRQGCPVASSTHSRLSLRIASKDSGLLMDFAT